MEIPKMTDSGPLHHEAEAEDLAVVHTALGRVGGAERQLVRFVSAARAAGFRIQLFYGGPEAHGLAKLGNLFVEARPSTPMRVLKSYLRLLAQLRHYQTVLIYHHLDPLLLAAVAGLHGEKCVVYLGEPLRPLWEEYVSGDRSLISSGAMATTVQQLWGGPATAVLSHEKLFSAARWLLRKVDRASVRKLRAVLTNSIFTARAVRKVYGVDTNPTVVYQGIPLESIPITPPLDRMVVLNVGAYLPMKEQSTLLRAWGRVLNEPIAARYELVLVGSGPLLDESKRLASSLKLTRVRFIPYASDEALRELYARSTVLVHCAVAEPFGMTPVEAAEYGVPSIVARSGGIVEFVSDGKTGWSYVPRDVEDLSRCLLAALRDPDHSASIGRNACERLRDHFSIEQNVFGIMKETGQVLHSGSN